MKTLIVLIIVILVPFFLAAQPGFNSITNLDPVPVSTDTGEKPQAKVWSYAGKHWAVLPNSSGTHLWRLDGITWTNVLRLSTRTSSKADTKMVGNAAHILLFQGASSQLVSVEYSEALGTYQLWSKRTSTVGLNLKTSTETATIDIDGNGRMWLAYDGTSDINVIWSDSPYHNWSTPVTLATTVNTDDICAVIALPGKVGVFWSDQNAKRFGFRTHIDGANPTIWSANEVPASQSAQNYGAGMADDHMNLAVASDGTLYSAVKTGYDGGGLPTIALLIRRPSGVWDDLYEVSGRGTRPIVILNEELNKVRVIFPEKNGGGVMYYRESSTINISFGPEFKLMDGSSNNPTSSKDNFTSEVVVLASNNTHAVGVLASEGTLSPELHPPLLSSPTNFSNNVSIAPTLSWNASPGAENYEIQVSLEDNFTTLAFHQNKVEETSVAVSELANNITYYWRVRAMNSEIQSEWSTVWRFSTTPANSGSNLIAHWKMDEGSGTTLIDGSDYGNHGAISGNPTWITGKHRQAIRFNGSNQYATVEDNNTIDMDGAVTIAMWVKPEKLATQYLIKKAAQNSVDGYELALSGLGKFFFRFNQKSSGDTYRINSNVNYPTSG
ncbi:MAG TPA: fibronectin type III domain-containing protein, partial [Gillisia sp.]|nr:fibronectin type III domain-containing protein [Gillisia sp.]